MVLYLCTAVQWSYNNIELLPYLCSHNVTLQGLIWLGVKFSFYFKPLICNLKGAFTFSFKGDSISSIEYKWKRNNSPREAKWRGLLQFTTTCVVSSTKNCIALIQCFVYTGISVFPEADIQEFLSPLINVFLSYDSSLKKKVLSSSSN